MAAKQMLLFPDPRPLVERLGADFFRTLPEWPGVYVMRDARDAVLYVGKAKNLRKRLNSYRVANPERLRRRHLRLLRAVARIECEECADELSALTREATLIREWRPPFNRAGTWPAPPRFLCWRLAERGLELGLFDQSESCWTSRGPLRGGAFPLYATLARLLWLGLNPRRLASELPAGWITGELDRQVSLPCPEEEGRAAGQSIGQLFAGNSESMTSWLKSRGVKERFDQALLDEDLESLRRWFPSISPARRPTHS